MSEIISADCTIAVIKIGGSILKNARAYRRAARFVRNRHFASPDERLVVVVSAQEGVTDNLAGIAHRISSEPNPAALDLLWSTGELRSVALLVLHLQALGISAAALNIHEAGLSVAGDGRGALGGPSGGSFSGTPAARLNPRRLRAVLARHAVAVVPGFFATDPANAVVSLGRGGSDLTAVLLATGLEAARCELLKDVAGYFTSDPHLDPTARHVPQLTFEEALAYANDGCDLVQRQAIEAAAGANLPLVVRSLDENAPLSRIAAAEAEADWSAADSAEAVETPQ